LKTWIILGILAALLCACGGTAAVPTAAPIAVVPTAPSIEAVDPCSDAALNSYADEIEEKLTTFEAQTVVTAATPRVGMGVSLQRLVDIQQETRRIEAPECLAVFHTQVLHMMGLYRLGYETFAAQGSPKKSQVSLANGALELQTARDGLANIRTGEIPPAPSPTPIITPGQGVING
jgi:hypothetical protein